MRTIDQGDGEAGRDRAEERPSAMAALSRFIHKPNPPAALDEIDLELLRLLARDSRLSQRALSREVALSAPAVGDRIARLERLGVIRGYTLELDWAALGYPMTVHIPIAAAPGADLVEIIDTLREMPEVEEIHVVTGQWDLMARFRISDHGNLQEVLLGKVWQIPGIQRVETTLELTRIPGRDPLGITDPLGFGTPEAEDHDSEGQDPKP